MPAESLPLAHSRIPRPPRGRVIAVAVTAVLTVALYYLLPDGVTEPQRRMLCIFLVASVFWALEVLPLFATSLMVIALMILALATDGGIAATLPGVTPLPEGYEVKASAFLSPFGSNIIVLFMGGFLLSRALTKHGIDRALAAKVLRPFSSSPLMLIYGVMGISAFASMWMSNTATAALVLAIIAPLLRSMPRADKFHRGVILAVPFGANIGGVGTPIGTPPNAVAFAAINKAGYSISFLDWMMVGIPLAVILLAVTGVALYMLHKPAPGLVLERVEGPGKVSWYGKLTVAVLLSAVTLWLTGQWHGIGAGTVALLAAAALTMLHVLDKHDVDTIDWNILILMWGGLAMGVGMSASGLTALIADADPTSLPGGTLVLAAGVVAVSILLSTFMSNTATANLMVPIIMALAVSADQRMHLALACALACSFAMAMPVSTPPNAIAFATGEVRASTLLRLGGAVSLLGGLLLIAAYKVWLPVVL